MLRAWPKTIPCGHAQDLINNAHKTGLKQNRFAPAFFGHGRKTPCRAGLYARISTHDLQTLSLQRRAMRNYAARRGWTVAIDVRGRLGSFRARAPAEVCSMPRAAATSMSS